MPDILFKIAGFVIALRSEQDQGNFSIDEGYEKFFTDDPPQVNLHHTWQDPPPLTDWEKVFDTQGVWQLYRRDEQFAVALYSPIYGAEPYKVATFSTDFRQGIIYTSRTTFDELPFPLRYPLAEILMINLLAQGSGLLLHACGIKDGQSGIVFSGVSGAGKSTTARLWEGQSGVSLLSDDRVILRKNRDGYYIYGTPWHGDARASSPDCARLERIYILQHASENIMTPLRPVDLASRLFVRSFPSYWNRSGMEYALELLEGVSLAVPGYELGFVPDHSIIEYVR